MSSTQQKTAMIQSAMGITLSLYKGVIDSKTTLYQRVVPVSEGQKKLHITLSMYVYVSL